MVESMDYKFIVDQWLWCLGKGTKDFVLEQLRSSTDVEIARELWEAWGDSDDEEWDYVKILEAVADVRRSYAKEEHDA